MKVLILGGTGFIGQHVVKKLLEDNCQVTVFDRHADRLKLSGIEAINADFSDTLSLSESLIGVDKVIHLISTSVPSSSNKDPVSDIQGNLVNTVKLLEIMRQSGIKDIVYFSSGGTVYGHPEVLPINESHTNHPVCSYGIVKLAIEKYLHMYSELYSLNAVILRPSNPFGPGQTHTGVQGFIGTCIAAALTGKPLTIWGDGSVKRDYVYVTDVADAAISALNYSKSDTFNISSGEGVSLNDIIQLVQNESGKKINLHYQEKRDFDIPEITLDNNKAKQLLGWQPSTSFNDGLHLTLNHAMKLV
ncbi:MULTISPECIES: NAD-dependent epimerase/dehydratase family protein [unclassified Methylophaga]|uniref:NAD-dependent epimerase/dehydratase family protein n=1 Tax=unclassified Methylophaga TaxID=2629249 RepID=UPI00259CFCF7|nr:MULTISPECIES: NAD-dependent epimerase/dehydratase family protein [unclassified Methylophaga]